MPSLIWMARWLANLLPSLLALLLPRSVVEAAYRQLLRHWAER